MNISFVHYSIKPPFGAPGYNLDSKPPTSVPNEVMAPAWQGRSIAGPKLRLVEFSAFLEQTRDPESVGVSKVIVTLWWVTLNILTISLYLRAKYYRKHGYFSWGKISRNRWRNLWCRYVRGMFYDRIWNEFSFMLCVFVYTLARGYKTVWNENSFRILSHVKLTKTLYKYIKDIYWVSLPTLQQKIR